MAFQLKPNEPVGEGITRNVRRQIEKAITHLAAKQTSSRRSVPESEAVFEVRKSFKRIRAALRLAREELGTELYREENWCFRDAARPLTEIRDAQILVESVDKLKQELVKVIGPAALAKIRRALLANQQDVARRVLEEDKAFAMVEDAATRALARLADWKLMRDGWPALEPGLRRVYRTGHRALALAAENPSVENLHELRKQAKYLWHELQLVEGGLTGNETELAGQAHKLSTLLGEDHDLAVLRQTLAADPLVYGGHRILKGAFAVIDHQRQELERQGVALAQEVYKDPPKAFTSRIEASMHCQEVR